MTPRSVAEVLSKTALAALCRHVLLRGIAAVLTVWLCFDLIVSKTFVSPGVEKIRADTELHWGSVEHDLRLISSHPFYRQQRDGRDAGAVLNPRLRWRGRVYDPLESNHELAMSADVDDQLRTWGNDWVNRAAEPLVAASHTDWLSALHNYSRWDIHGELDIIDPTALAFPNTADLQNAAKLHLLAAVADRNLAGARADVAHFAWLAYTTNTLLGAATSLALLNFDRQIYESHRTTLGDSAGPPPVDAEVISAARRALVAVARAPLLSLDEQQLTRVLTSVGDTAGRCLISSEAAFLALQFRDPLKDRLPRQFDVIRRQISATETECGLNWLTAMWDGGRAGPPPAMLLAMSESSWPARLALRVLSDTPGIREPLHMGLLVMATPFAFNRYVNAELEHASKP